MRALTGLKQAGQAAQAAQQQVKGRPDEMPLKKIMRDPGNPRPPLHMRTPEEQQKQRELNANIKKRGVKSPISLRPHPTIPDMWIINHGHCRYDAAEEGGLPTIPYFIDQNFDSYDQVAENLHRADLSPWSIAEFIKRKLKEKQTKGQIAEGLGKENESYITEHLALVDAPKSLHQAYTSGVRSTRTLYDLRRAYEEFPDQIESWCDAGPKITRDTIKDLLQALRAERNQVPAGTATPQLPQQSAVPQFRHDEKESPASTPPGPDGTTSDQEKLVPERPMQAPPAADLHLVENTPAANPHAVPTAPEFRHDEKNSLSAVRHHASAGSPEFRPPGGVVLAMYKGKPAKIAPNTTVKILVEGRDALLEVPLSELVFPGTK